MIYLMRSDVMSTVRQMSWRVWKGVVSNTPRMLGNVLNTLMDKVIADLASVCLSSSCTALQIILLVFRHSPTHPHSQDNGEQQEAASAALGDLVQKMGELSTFLTNQFIPRYPSNR
jgi:hypothetical protein